MSDHAHGITKSRRPRALVEWDMLRVAWAAKTGIACFLAELAACHLKLSMGFWAVITAFLLIQLSTSATLKKGLFRVIGTVTGCGCAYLALVLLPVSPALMLCVLIPWMAVFLYFSYKGYYPYAFFIAAYTPVITVCDGIAGNSLPWPIVMSRFVDILVGVIIAGIVAGLFWRTDDTRELIRHSGMALKKTLSLALSVIKDSSPPESVKQGEYLMRLLRRHSFLVQNCDFSAAPWKAAHFNELSTHYTYLLFHTLHIAHIFRDPPVLLTQDFAQSSSGSAEFHDRVEVPRYIVDMHTELQNIKSDDVLSYMATQAPSPASDLLMEPFLLGLLRDETGQGDRKLIKAGLLLHIHELLRALPDLLNRENPEQGKKTPAREETGGGRGKFRMALNRDAMIQSLKTSLSTVVTILLWVIPFHNAQAAISAFLLSNPSHAASSRRFLFRIAGTLVGGAAGFILVMALRDSALPIIGLVSLILAVFAYISLGYEEWSYVGFTAAICFILCVGTALDPDLSRRIVLHRMGGVVLGGVTGILLSLIVIPTDYLGKIHMLSRELHTRYQEALRLVLSSLSVSAADAGEVKDIDALLRQKSIEYQSLAVDLSWDLLSVRESRKFLMNHPRSVIGLYQCFVSIAHLITSLKDRKILIDTRDFLNNVIPSLEETLSRAEEICLLSDSDSLQKARKDIEHYARSIAAERQQIIKSQPSSRNLKNMFFMRLLLIEFGEMLRERSAR